MYWLTSVHHRTAVKSKKMKIVSTTLVNYQKGVHKIPHLILNLILSLFAILSQCSASELTEYESFTLSPSTYSSDCGLNWSDSILTRLTESESKFDPHAALTTSSTINIGGKIKLIRRKSRKNKNKVSYVRKRELPLQQHLTITTTAPTLLNRAHHYAYYIHKKPGQNNITATPGDQFMPTIPLHHVSQAEWRGMSNPNLRDVISDILVGDQGQGQDHRAEASEIHPMVILPEQDTNNFTDYTNDPMMAHQSSVSEEITLAPPHVLNQTSEQIKTDKAEFSIVQSIPFSSHSYTDDVTDGDGVSDKNQQSTNSSVDNYWKQDWTSYNYYDGTENWASDNDIVHSDIHEVSSVFCLSDLLIEHKIIAWVFILSNLVMIAAVGMFIFNTNIVQAREQITKRLMDPTLLIFISRALRKYEDYNFVEFDQRSLGKKIRKRKRVF